MKSNIKVIFFKVVGSCFCLLHKNNKQPLKLCLASVEKFNKPKEKKIDNYIKETNSISNRRQRTTKYRARGF